MKPSRPASAENKGPNLSHNRDLSKKILDNRYTDTITWSMLPRRLTLPPHPPAKLNPSPSHSYKLLCAPKRVNSLQISNFQTLFAKHPGWGHIRIHPISFAPAIAHAPRSASIPSALNQLRILPVATGVYPAFILSLLVQLYRPGSSLELPVTCSLFGLSLRSFSTSGSLFSIACSLFSKNTRGGGVSVALDTHTTRWILGKQSRSTQS